MPARLPGGDPRSFQKQNQEQEPVPFSYKKLEPERVPHQMFEKSKFLFSFSSYTRQNLNTKARHRISYVLVAYSFHILVPALYKVVAAYALPSVHKDYTNNKEQHV